MRAAVWVVVGLVVIFAGLWGSYIYWERNKVKSVEREPGCRVDDSRTDLLARRFVHAARGAIEVSTRSGASGKHRKKTRFWCSEAPANSNNAADLKAEIQALSKLQQEQSTKLDALDVQARKAIAGIRTDDSTPSSNAPATESYQKPPGQPGGVAGTSFHLVGNWGVVASPPYSVSRVQFQPNGRFAGQTTDVNGISRQVSGTVTYNPGTSMLAVNYDDGSWFQSRILKWGVGFYTTFSFNGSQVEMYLEPENKSGYSSIR